MNIQPIRLSVTTCYLIPLESGYLLADTGYDQDWPLFCARLRDAGVSFSQIEYVLLTHHHDDHCGLLHRLLEQNPAIRVVLSAKGVELIAKGSNDQAHGGGLVNRRVAFLLRNLKQIYLSLLTRQKVDKEHNLEFEPYQLRTGDIVVAGDTSFRGIGIALDGGMLETPGHTVDSLSVLLSDGDCLVGDAAADMLAFAGTRHCVVFIMDLTLYYESWRKLMQAGARRILPAHGKPFSVDMLRRDIGRNRPEHMVT